MRRRRALVVVALGAVAAGFGAGEMRARAGVRAELASPLFAAPVDEAPARERVLPVRAEAHPLAAAPVLRIDGDDGVGFGRLADVAPSRSGDTVYVLDQMEARVTAFTRGGLFLFDFGRKGPGPGEFTGPTQLLVLPWSGEVAVWDREAQRLTLHAPDGSRSRVVDPAAGSRRTRSRTVERLAAFGSGYVMQVHADPLEVRPDRQRGALVRLDTAFQAIDTLVRFAVAGVRAWHVETAAGSSATTWLNPPVFSPAPSWDVTADGTVLFAPGGPAEAYRLGADGALRVRWPSPPRRITREDRLRRLAGEIDTGLLRVPEVPLGFLEALHRRYLRARAAGGYGRPGGTGRRGLGAPLRRGGELGGARPHLGPRRVGGPGARPGAAAAALPPAAHRGRVDLRDRLRRQLRGPGGGLSPCGDRSPVKNRIYLASILLLSLVLTAGAWNGMRAAHRWVNAPRQALAAGRPTEHDRALRVKPGSALAELAAAERAIVFVYSPGCAVSRANMVNWTELVRRTRGGRVALFAVGPVDADSAAAYWGALARHVRVVPAPAEEIEAVLGVRATPVTLGVAHGRIRTEAPGPLRAAARGELLAFAADAD